jgi:hypothetical protein
MWFILFVILVLRLKNIPKKKIEFGEHLNLNKFLYRSPEVSHISSFWCRLIVYSTIQFDPLLIKSKLIFGIGSVADILPFIV